VRGKVVSVSSAEVLGHTVITTGRWLRVASIHDDRLVDKRLSVDDGSFIAALKQTRLNADVFTFAQQLPNTVPMHSFHREWDNLAVIPITTFADWWGTRINSDKRNAVRKSAKTGIVVKQTQLDDDLIMGIVSINNETPVRQGRAFWHFNKSFEAVKAENSTYPQRSIFIGAYYHDQLIGVVRMICASKIAHMPLFLSMTRYHDKKTGNAMIAKAVELCAQNGMSHLVYGQYAYNDVESSLTEFKRRNGFERILVPRYFVPLTWRGEVAIRLGLHRGFASRLPKELRAQLLRMRTRWYTRRLNADKAGG
jgi:hypothetical protein